MAGYEKRSGCMKIITIFFARNRKYNKLLNVFETSLKSCMPNVPYSRIEIKLPPNIDHKRDCAYAFLAAANYVKEQKEKIIVCDADLMFLQSIEEINNYDFDIAITTRKKIKYNTGLWVYNPSSKSKKFLTRWIRYTNNLMNDFTNYEDFCWSHGGIDQASLALTIEKNNECKILELPCEIWNSTQSEWALYNEETKVVHIKSKLRSLLFNRDRNAEIEDKYKYLIPLMEKWKGFSRNGNT